MGFNLGRFTMKEATIPGKLGDNLTVDAYANTTPPDNFQSMQGGVLGTLDTRSMLPVQLSQGEVAARLYTDYFGDLPFARVALTQQYACNYGQSWPMLVYLPICGFLDTTQQHFMGLRPEDMYWKVVTPHEVAHQWWGQTVGFRSYRDQWMSEGFANTSASIFLQITRPKPDDFREFWKQQRRLDHRKECAGLPTHRRGSGDHGHAPELGEDRMGYLSESGLSQGRIHPAHDSHDDVGPEEGDDRFRATMHDLVATHIACRPPPRRTSRPWWKST